MMTLSEANARIDDAMPVFLVGDIAKTMRWYMDRLGFSARAVPALPPHNFCIMNRDGVSIFLQQLEGYAKPDLYEQREGGVWDVYLQTNDVRDVLENGSGLSDVTIVETLGHRDYGQTEFVIRDPNGYVLVFAEPD
jgi:hypothetical protein